MWVIGYAICGVIENDKRIVFPSNIQISRQSSSLRHANFFLPAGTLHYWNAWLLMGILFIPMFPAGIVMMFKNPNLLRKRLNAKEKEAEQSTVIKPSGLMFVLGFVTAGLSFRFRWLIEDPQ